MTQVEPAVRGPALGSKKQHARLWSRSTRFWSWSWRAVSPCVVASPGRRFESPAVGALRRTGLALCLAGPAHSMGGQAQVTAPVRSPKWSWLWAPDPTDRIGALAHVPKPLPGGVPSDGASEPKNAPAGFGGLPGHLWHRMLVVALTDGATLRSCG